MRQFLRLSKTKYTKNTARYQLYPMGQSTFSKPYNLKDNLDPNKEYIGLKDEYDK